MDLKSAKRLRDEIREAGPHCIVPLGHGPKGYFARIYVWNEKRRTLVDTDFRSRRAWLAYQRASEKEKAAREAAFLRMCRPRSVIEMMIDQACGITQETDP